MKKKLLMTAMVAALGGVGTAQAVHVNSDGLGQVLIYPYYTVQNGFDSYINLVNTTDEVKAVKVRFLEGKNSQEVLDFNLYLSPNDEWSGKVTTSASGGAKLESSDTSCIAPSQIKAGGEDFRNLQYQADSIKTVARTREGYVEVIEMGVVTDTDSIAAATHVGGSATVIAAPANCGLIRTNAKSTTGLFNGAKASNGISAPTGGLYGFVTLINVNSGLKTTVDAIAIDNFFVDQVVAGNPLGLDLHFAPGTTSPSLEDVNTDGEIIDGASIITFSSANPVDSLSAILTRSNVYNDYSIDAGRDSKTDWVLTFPTKRFYVNTSTPAPFTETWKTATSTSCDPIQIVYYDREERRHNVTIDEDFSPKPDVVAATNSLCNEVNTLSIKRFGTAAGTSTLFGAEYTNASFTVDDAGFVAGWMNVSFANTLAGDVSIGGQTPVPGTLIGLPVVGFSALSNSNGTLVVGGVNVLSNYLGSSAHKGVRALTTP
ncbi:MAG: hypothetical protein PHI64_02775 [Zoogloea sp.]|uniref:hypothetical protein n=1 Tax=Zoogloea sp. TaxID=49181 RepID=UPI0026374881|nr:hypothetical protein [Zoogloea sp.]MDD2987861.1 hypothetical protein [Zoogloea sp.]